MNIPIKIAFNNAWNLFKINYLKYILFSLLIFVIAIFAHTILFGFQYLGVYSSDMLELYRGSFGIQIILLATQLALFCINIFVPSFLGCWLTLTYYCFFLDNYHNKATEISITLFKPKAEIFFYYLIASWLVGAAIGIGFLLLIIPGIILFARMAFYGFLIIDEKHGPLSSIEESWLLTKGHTWKLIGFFALALLFNLLGFLCLIFGTLVTAPITFLAFINIFEQLKRAQDMSSKIESSTN